MSAYQIAQTTRRPSRKNKGRLPRSIEDGVPSVGANTQQQCFRDPNAPVPEPSHSAPRGQDGPRIGSGPRSQARRNSASGGGGNGSSEVRGPSSGRIPAVQPMSSVSLFHRDDECARPPKRTPKRFLHT